MPESRQTTAHDRLAHAIERVPKAMWADRFGRSEKQLRRYLAGADIPLSVMLTVANATGVPIDWIVSGRGSDSGADPGPVTVGRAGADDRDAPTGTVAEGSRTYVEVSERQMTDRSGKAMTINSFQIRPAVLSNYVSFSRRNAEAVEGWADLVNHPQVVEYMALDRDLLRSLRLDADELLLVQTPGDEMAPAIPAGSILTVDLTEGRPMVSGAVYVVRVGDALSARRFEQRLDGTVTLRSDNPRYEPEHMDRAAFDRVGVLGIVVMVLTVRPPDHGRPAMRIKGEAPQLDE